MSTVSGRAEIEARLSHVEEVVSGLKQIGGAVDQTATKAGKVEGAFKGVVGSLVGVARAGLTAAGVMQGIDIAKSVEQARQLDATTARWGQSAKTSGDELKSQMEAVEKRSMTAANQVANVAKSLGRATYDGQGAAAAMNDLADFALATGQELADTGSAYLAMRQGLGVTRDFGAELGRVRDIAEQVGTIGGPMALMDTLAGLRPQLQGVRTDSETARSKLESFVAVLGKGRSQERAQEVAGSALQFMKSRALDIERATGERVIDDQGQIIDPQSTLRNLKRLGTKKFGKNKEALRRATISEYGVDLGTAILAADEKEMASTANNAVDFGKYRTEADAFRGSKEGKREQARVDKEAAMRKQAGERALGVSDWMNDKLGPWGSLAAGVGGERALEWAGGKALGWLGGKAAGGAASQVATGAGGVGFGALAAGGALGGLFGLGALAATGLGEDRDTMGRKWRNKQAPAIGAELAQQAVTAGDLTPVIGKAGGDKEVIAEMLKVLEGRFAELNETMRTQVAAGIAAELRRAPLVLRPPQSPNKPTASGGN